VDPAKYKALEARLRELERKNDFLKKVSAFFAKEQR
jgi:transposase